jgi:hypothetical protein
MTKKTLTVGDLVVGGKYVPHDKTVWAGLSESVVWERAVAKGQPFLYYMGLYDGTQHTFNDTENNGTMSGDMFNPEDMTKYVEPNPLPKRGDRVLVWDVEEKNAKTRIFLAYIEKGNNPVIAVDPIYEEEFLNNKEFSYDLYQKYKPIPKEDTSLVELTMDEALEKLAKLENVDVSRLRIKK